MSKYLSQKTSHIWLIALMGFGMCALLFGTVFFKSNRAQGAPVNAKRPLPHVRPKETYDYDLDLAFKNLKKPFPSIKTVREISEDYVRPRRKRQHMMETSEAGALVILDDERYKTGADVIAKLAQCAVFARKDPNCITARRV